jgi:hypothetical protein
VLEVLIVAGGIVLLGGGFYLRRTMPWPFRYEGRKYRRMPDGTFQDAAKAPVTDTALIPKLVEAYEVTKYGRRDMLDLDMDNS